MPEGLSFGKVDRRALDVDRELLSGAIDDLDVVELTPGSADLFGGATVAEAGPGAGVNASAIVLGNAADHYARWTQRVRSAWISHSPLVTVFYTSGTGSTANFRLVISAEATHSGVNMSAGPVIDSGAVLAPGPAAAHDVQTASIELSATPATSETDQLLSFRVLRTGSHVDDANTNALQVLLVTVQMRPA